MKYLYGLRLRGFSPGCQPRDGFVEVADSWFTKEYSQKRGVNYHDTLIYSRKLKDDELEKYEMDFFGVINELQI